MSLTDNLRRQSLLVLMSCFLYFTFTSCRKSLGLEDKEDKTDVDGIKKTSDLIQKMLAD